jgi:long-chain acyl-CoA synthetase
MNSNIDTIITDPNAGAGNLFNRLVELMPTSKDRNIYLDDPLPYISHNPVSLEDLCHYAAKLSRWYLERGVTVKDPICLYFEDSLNYFVHYVALTNVGAIPVFINGGLNVDIATQFAQRIGSKMMLTDESRHESVETSMKKYDYNATVHLLETVECSSLSPVKKFYRHVARDIVLLAHTSGTTGIPKAVQFNHSGFFFGVRQQVKKMFGKRIMNALPHSHASALSIMMSFTLRGATIKIQTKKSPLDVLETIEQFRPDFFVSFPKIYTDMCRYDFADYDLSSISYWLSTGDVNHQSHIMKLMNQGSHEVGGEKRPGSLFVDNLGSSEFGFAAFRNIHSPQKQRFNRCIGIPLDWVSAAILDQNGEICPPNTVGYLGVASESVTSGYWNNTLLTEKNRMGNYWLTGDWAYQDEEGYFYHVDRITDSIQTPTGILYSAQLEELLMSNFPELFDCSVVGVACGAQEIWPKIICEVLEGADITSLHNKIERFLADRDIQKLAGITFDMKPHFYGVTGKVLKRVLREEA